MSSPQSAPVAQYLAMNRDPFTGPIFIIRHHYKTVFSFVYVFCQPTSPLCGNVAYDLRAHWNDA